MSDALTLRLRQLPAQRVDLSPLRPDQLAGMSLTDIAALPLWAGRRQLSVGELFELSGDDPSSLVITNACERLDNIGAGMQNGRLRIDGPVGHYLGRGMQDGEIALNGSCRSYAGSAMRGGLLRIVGHAGDYLGAAAPGERSGMRGGAIVVEGDAGERVADRLRRGTIVVSGSVGSYCGSRMIAGTIAVLGQAGAGAGFAMQRGTLWLNAAPAGVPATFNDNGEQALPFLALLAKEINSLAGNAIVPPDTTRARRWVGDRGVGGLGEILVPL